MTAVGTASLQKRHNIGVRREVERGNIRVPMRKAASPSRSHALKYGSLEGALESIQKVTGEHTVIMSLMNGVDSEEIIGRTVGMEHVLPALIKVASHKEEDGYHFDPPTTLGIIFGEPFAPFDSERVKAVEELFADTGIHFRSTEYIQEEIWCKFCLNVCSNLPQAILGAGVGCYRDSVHMKAISDGLKRELEAVAQAKGIDMSKTESSSGRGSAVPPSARYSTLQDLDAGCHTEIDMFSGALVRMGKELGIPMPYNEYTYHMIKALEEKNDGKFDYTYNERMVILPYTIQLLRSDSDTRKAVLPIFNGNGEDDTLYYHGNKRIPCSMYYDFLIRENSKREKVLHICYHQRSSDFVTHFGNDVYLAWRLMEYVAKEVGVKPGYLYHTIDSLHTYQKDWDKLASSLRVFEDTII